MAHELSNKLCPQCGERMFSPWPEPRTVYESRYLCSRAGCLTYDPQVTQEEANAEYVRKHG